MEIMKTDFGIGGIFDVVCKRKDGSIRWQDTAKNLVPNTALDNILDVILHGETPITTWYLGLKDTGTPAASDTLASHSTWTENTNYTGDRQEFVEAASSSQSVTNSASKAEFAINVDAQTIAGAFLASAATGTSGVLFSVADFTGGDKACDNGDTLQVTYTVSANSN